MAWQTSLGGRLLEPVTHSWSLIGDSDGRITSGREMFGNRTPLSWDNIGVCASHGFEVLAWFDLPEQGGDGDHWITAADRVFSALRVWIDANHDGVTQPEELQRLDQVGVVALSDQAQESRRVDDHGNLFRYRAKLRMLNRRGGIVTRFAYDVFLVSF